MVILRAPGDTSYKLQDSTPNGVAIYRIYTQICSDVPLFVYEARKLGMSR